MFMAKRIVLFLITNILVMVGVSLILNLFGFTGYLTAAGINYSQLAIFCLVWGSVGSAFSLMISKWSAKRMMGVEIVNEDPRYSDLVCMVTRISETAGLPKLPEIGVYHSPEVNAFATGPSRSNSLVAVSTGLLDRMSRDEVEGVLAHEVAHVANGDMVTMALIQGIINAFVMFFARVAAFGLAQIMRGDDDESPVMGGMAMWISTMVFELIFGFLGMFVVAFFSRVREYRADAGAADYVGKGKMIAALQRLQQNVEFVDDSVDSVKAMKISSVKGLMSFLSTHPPLEERILALQNR